MKWRCSGRGITGSACGRNGSRSRYNGRFRECGRRGRTRRDAIRQSIRDICRARQICAAVMLSIV